MSHKEQIIIGIDPDVDRNGIAMLDMSTHSLQVQMLTFPNLLDFIKSRNTANSQKLTNGTSRSSSRLDG